MVKSDDELNNHLDVPIVVSINGLGSRQRHKVLFWLLLASFKKLN
jgi:hypothetical protein